MFKRIATAIIGIPIAAFIVSRGGGLFTAAILFLALVAFRELKNMAATQGNIIYCATSGTCIALLILAAGFDMAWLLLPALTLGVLAVLIEGLINHCCLGELHWERNTSLSIMAIGYVGLLFAHLPMLRGMSGPRAEFFGMQFEFGELALWMILLGTWASDTFAYFVGRALGKHKFCSVSPKKSMEGAVGGFIACVFVVMYIGVKGLEFSLPFAFITGLVVAFLAPIGDLVESICKRSFAVKDSGNFFPGHGGVLDRFDSLLFAAPASYYILTLASLQIF